MANESINTTLIAACGLYCGNCSKYKKGNCPGCKLNTKATWCKIRTCCADSRIENCAQCKQFSDTRACKTHNNFIGKIFSVIFQSDRAASIDYVRKHGPEAYIGKMNHVNQMCVKRKQSL